MPENPLKGLFQCATDSGPRPADFPIGSPESRAAARAALEHRSRNLTFLIMGIPRPPWCPDRGPLSRRIKNARSGGIVTVFSDDLDDPDLPPSTREYLQAA